VNHATGVSYRPNGAVVMMIENPFGHRFGTRHAAPFAKTLWYFCLTVIIASIQL
jgi:hypothetical protein